MFQFKLSLAVLASAAVLGGPLWTSAAYAAATYVIICPNHGDGFMFIPGTATCLNANTGETIDYNTGDRGESELKKDIDDAAAGGAVSLSLPGAVVDPGKNFGAAVNLGYFNEQTALGVSGAYRPIDGITVNGGVGISTGSGTVGGRAGVNFSW